MQYDVALSYAGEDREQARELAKLIQTAGYAVFYDQFESLWGQDLSVKLHEVYEKQSRFCVIFVSKHYLRKPWANLERKAMLTRAMQQEAVYLLPIRLDDSDLPGLPGVTAYKDLRQSSLEEIFECLKRILGPPPAGVTQRALSRRPEDAIVRMYPQNFLGIVVQKDNLQAPWFNLDCHLINESRKPARVQRLEALVTPVGKRGMPFGWNLFYEFLPGGRVMAKTADAAALEVGPEASRLLGVQFLGPPLNWELQWPVGRYRFEILGWVDRDPREPEPDLQTKFEVQISPRDWQWLNLWARAPEREWERLNDPHNAVAIPLKIEAIEAA